MSTKQQDKTKSRRKTGRPPGKALAEEAAPPAAKGKVRKGAARPADTGIPDEAHIEQATAGLESADRTAVRRILSALTEHLGSPQAARLWLVTRSPEFGTTPLSAIAEGKANLVLALLESRWGPSPTYA